MALREFQERKALWKILASWPAILLLGTLLIFAGIGFFKIFSRYLKIKHDVVALEERIVAQGASRQDFEARALNLATPEGLEKEARARFNLKKPGEEVIVFLDSKNQPVSQPRGFKESAASVLETIWRVIKNIFSF